MNRDEGPDTARRFAESDFVFNRARTGIAFVPLAWIDATVYDESRFMMPSGEVSEISFAQKTLSVLEPG